MKLVSYLNVKAITNKRLAACVHVSVISCGHVMISCVYYVSLCVCLSVTMLPLGKNDQAGEPETCFKLCLALYSYP